MAEMACVSDSIKSIVPEPEANLSTKLQEMFPADRQREEHKWKHNLLHRGDETSTVNWMKAFISVSDTSGHVM